MLAPVVDALLVVVAIAYLGGAVLMVAALVKVLVTWTDGWCTRCSAGSVDEALQHRAAMAMVAVAELANVAAPPTDVVAILGVSTGDAEHLVGDGGLAVTRFRPGRPATVVFARAAITGLSCAALQSLAAHELAHVIRRTRASAAALRVAARLPGAGARRRRSHRHRARCCAAAGRPGAAGHGHCRRGVPGIACRLGPARGDRRRSVCGRPDA